ncbi:MAG: hypothetical protein JWN15_2074 [Firmicutes bacterium]|nr:hypothetical protein [Bacillota bacterium]
MTIQVFVRDVALPPLPPELAPYLSQLMQTAGHRVRWAPAHRALLIDSPLDGRLVRCLVAAPHTRMAGLIATDLVRWVQLAGAAVVAGAGRRADLTVVVRVEPLPQGGSPTVHVASRPGHWFSRRDSLATSVAVKLREAMRLPVAVTHRWSAGKNELSLCVAAPADDRFAQFLSKALWQGLMAHFCTSAVMLDAVMVAAPVPALQPEPVVAPQPAPVLAPQAAPEPALQLAPARQPHSKRTPHAPRVIWSSDEPILRQATATPMTAHRQPQQPSTPAVRAASWSADNRH